MAVIASFILSVVASIVYIGLIGLLGHKIASAQAKITK